MGIKKRSEIIVDSFLLLIGIGLRINAQTIRVGNTLGQGSDFMPKLCTTLWIVIAAGLLLEALRMEDDKDKKLEMSLTGFFLTILLLTAYIFFLKKLGFVLSSVLYMFLQMMLFVPPVYRTKKNIIIFLVLSLFVPIAVYELFVNAFGLLLPAGKLF